MNEYKNGILEINPVKDKELDLHNLALGLAFTIGGAHVSGYDKRISTVFVNKWEIFDPEKVEDPSDLPEHWYKVYTTHNEPNRKACRDLKYRYLHSPKELLPDYPKTYCSGIFVITNKDTPINKITGSDLIYIGDEIFGDV